MGISIFFNKAQLDIRSRNISKLDQIRTYGLVTQPIEIFSVDSQRNLFKTSGNAYLATKLRT